VTPTRPKGHILAISRPAWWTEIPIARNGSVVQLHHPEHGWLAFVFPPEHAAMLGVALVRHSGVCDYFAGTLPPSTMTVN
jgi:hypothetical protein